MTITSMWNFIMNAWKYFSHEMNCLFLKTRLARLNVEIEFMKKYIENSEKGGATMLANYFRQRLPTVTAERESLEAQIELADC
jgi:hypothetical protein